MGTIIAFPRRHHARNSASAGQRSGRSSDLEIPVARSIGRTNSAGTPFLERLSQYQTSDCLVPISSASLSWLPARSHASFSASIDMPPSYPNLGDLQPKNTLGTSNRKFGNNDDMRNKIDPVGFGQRVRERREQLGWGQAKLGKQAGYSQTNIGWVEQGNAKDPRKQALRLADALRTTPDWLLYGTGPREIGPQILTAAEYDALSIEDKEAIAELLNKVPKQRRAG